MAWKFRKRIKIAPGITINLSRSGVSTTIGTRGASVNIGKNGTYLNTGIPETGIYDRKKMAMELVNVFLRCPHKALRVEVILLYMIIQAAFGL